MSNEKMNEIKEVFDNLKNSKVTINDSDLDNFLDSCMYYAKQFEKTKQILALDKILFLMKCVTKERELIKKGINQFIYLEDILDFLEQPNIRNSEIKLIELEAYPRTIPEEIVNIVDETKDIFNKYYVLFTDYTGKVEKEMLRNNEAYRKEKDPILFGTFQEDENISNLNNNANKILMLLKNQKINNRFYFLGDWVDEFCDLTLEKFVSMTSKDIVKTIMTPLNKDEIAEEITRLDSNLKMIKSTPIKSKKPFFKRVFSAIKGK